MKIAQVYIEHPIPELDHTFAYRCDGFSVQRGVRVRVPFGVQSLIGFVDHVEEWDEEYLRQQSFAVKSIREVIDQEPLINEELFQLAKWMSQAYIAPVISCFQVMLPAKLKPRSSKETIKLEAYVCFQKEIEKLTEKQREALRQLQKNDVMLRSEFYKKFKSVGKKLIELGCARVVMKEAQASLSSYVPAPFLSLTSDQDDALQQIVSADPKEVILLHGATGSGKTEVFLQLAKRALEENKQVLLLVPEISLTPQMVKRVRERFGAQVAIYHSALNNQEKYEQYQLVKRHQVSIVVGTRSAIFMPFDHLGYIILDEEHDTSYKQDSTPRYHCRDIAIERGKFHHAKVILASATPSLESYARAHKHIYRLINMPHRIRQQLPKVHLVEMGKAIRHRENYLLSDVMLEKIQERLERREQIILLLNRRGYTPILRCMECGYVQMCPHCDIAMAYHKDAHRLKCHTCGYQMQLPSLCPSCNADSWRYLGSGTQRLEELVKEKFPDAGVLRMDADTTMRKNAHEKILAAFQRHEADILLGTQMIAKGLDVEKVTLVGILNGDALLNRSDYRCAEITYDLLEQACGRSGRGQYAGEVVIQTYDTSHYAITCAASHDYVSFFKQEMRYRHLAGYPPYTYLVSIVFANKHENQAKRDATFAKSLLTGDIRILGPVSLTKIHDEYRMRMILKGKDQLQLNQAASHLYREYQQARCSSRMEIDLHPIYLD